MQVGKSRSDDAAEEAGFEVGQLCLLAPCPAAQSNNFFFKLNSIVPNDCLPNDYLNNVGHKPWCP